MPTIDPDIYLHAAKRMAEHRNVLSCVAVFRAAMHADPTVPWPEVESFGSGHPAIRLYTEFFGPDVEVGNSHPFWNRTAVDIDDSGVMAAELRDLRVTALLFMHEIAKDLS